MGRSFRVFLTTCPEREAARIAEALLARRAVACVNVVRGVESRYWWKGKLESAREALLVMKSVGARAGEVARALRAVHPYEVFELVALPVVQGSPAYLRWVREVTAPPRAPRRTRRPSPRAGRRARTR